MLLILKKSVSYEWLRSNLYSKAILGSNNEDTKIKKKWIK